MRYQGWQRMSKNSKELVPERRFPEFEGDEQWEKEALGAHLDYLQPTKYLVSSTAYRDSYSTPVLTAGKTFVLGYTDEKEGIYSDNLPVIIFDDFTTSSKFVDFPFKAKSSAMKILVSKNETNIKFIYEAMQNLEYEVGVHERHWISIFSKLKIPIPKNSKEQQKVADCLSSLDELIVAHTQKHKMLQSHKKGLLQNLFPAEGETIPVFRFPEFENAGEWTIKPMKKLFKVGNGRDHKHLSNGEIPVYGSGGYMRSVDDYLYDGESVCIGRKGTIDKPIFLSGKFWTVDTLFYTHSFLNCLPKFIYLIFQNIDWRSQNEAGGVPSLSKSNIEKIEVALPSIEEQGKIVDCIFSVDGLISAQEQTIKKLKAHKKGLMQQLFPSMNVVEA